MEQLMDTIRHAGTLALREQKNLSSELKPDGTIVTSGDLAVSEFLERELQKQFPHYAIFSEENCQNVPTQDRVIIIDPIDGTNSYYRGTETWCVLVGFLEGLQPQKGFVYQPTTQKMFYAQKNKGSFLQIGSGEVLPLKALGRGPLSGSHSPKERGEREFYRRHHIERIDEMHSAALKILRVASGEIDLYANFQKACSVWDLAAPECILTEAGGRLEYAQPVQWNLQSPKVAEKFCAIGQRIPQLQW